MADGTIFAACPVTQAATAEYPGGREGYRLWLSKYMDGGRNVIPGIARAHGLGASDEIGKVCVMGFSNGCIGVDEVLGANDAQRIDVTLAVDGVHGSYASNGLPSPSQYKRYMNQAAHVAQFNAETERNGPIMVISHSSIVPGSFPSTTETAELIWSAVHPRCPSDYIPSGCGWGCVPWLHLESMRARYAEPVEKCSMNGCYTWYGMEDGWYDKRGANNFYVLGWGDVIGGKPHTKDPAGYADHVFQGQVVLHALLTEFVLQRWEPRCGAVSGLGEFPQRCTIPSGQNYGQAASAKVDYFPDVDEQDSSTNQLPQPCPYPPAGKVIVGKPGDPCALEDEPKLQQPEPETGSMVGNAAAGAIGLALGYGLGAYGYRLYKG